MTGLVALLVAALVVSVRAGMRSLVRERVSRRVAATTATTTATAATTAATTPAPGASPPPWAALVGAIPGPPRRLSSALAEADIAFDPAGCWALWVGAAAAAVVGALALAGTAAAVLALTLATVVPLVVLRARRGRSGIRVEAAMPAAMEAVARSLRSGASLRQAIEEAAPTIGGPLGGELRMVAAQATQGVPLATALDNLGRRRPLAGVTLAVRALSLGVETGGAQARSVDGVAATLRDRLALGAEVRALSSQARISALVIGLAPIGFGALSAATDPATADFVLGTPVGLTMLAAGLALDGLGWLWMQRLARGAVTG